jgi:hypothetical protein
LSDRGIDCYSSTRRNFTHCARRNFLNPRTGPGTRCESGQNGQTNRVPCACGIFSTLTAHPGRHNRNITWGGGANFDTAFFTGFAAARKTLLRGRAVRREACRFVLVAVIEMLSIPRRAGFIFSVSPNVGSPASDR